MQPTHLTGGRVPAALADLAFCRHGVVSRRDLRALGLSDREIDVRVGHGHLIRVHRGVYAVGHARLSAHGCWMAAVLACGESAVLSHADAAALHDLRRVPSGRIHVIATGRHRAAGVRCHVTRDPEGLRRTVVDGIPVTSLERTVLDEAVALSPQRLRSVLEEIERQNRLDLARFEALLGGANGHRGVGRLRAALGTLEVEAPAIRSGLEQRMLELIRATGLPDPSVNVVVSGETVDLRWPVQRVTVEIDSWRYHRSRRTFEEDRRRGNAVALGGEMLLRFTDRQIAAAPGATIAQVAAALQTAPGA